MSQCTHQRLTPRIAIVIVLSIPALSACSGVGGPLQSTEPGQFRLLPHEEASGQRGPSSAGAVAPADTSAAAPEKAVAATALAEARGLRRAGDRRKAFAIIEAAVARTPAPGRALLVEGGLLALEIGAPDQAERLLRRAMDQGEPDWRVVSGLGIAVSAQGRHEEAQRHFQTALRMAPGQAALLNNLAMAHMLARNPGEGEKVLRAAARVAPGSARIKQNLALAQDLKGHDLKGQAAKLPEPNAGGQAPAGAKEAGLDRRRSATNPLAASAATPAL